MIYQDVLATLFSASGYRTWLELGVGDGSMVRKALAVGAQVTAVDVEVRSLATVPDGCQKLLMTTERFFSLDYRAFDLIFIDADHKFKSVLADLLGALEVLAPGGVIALHDTDPSERKFLDPGHCNDAYRVVDHLLECNDLMSVTLPVGHEGLTLVRPKASRRVLGFPKAGS